MSLNVKARIAVAMAIVVAANLAAGAYSYHYFGEAARFAADAQAASDRARLVAQVSQRLTEYFGEAGDLALAVSSAELSEERSREYGDVIGADEAVTHAVRLLSADLAPAEASALTSEWADLRAVVYTWINKESTASGSGLLISRMSDGRYRASVGSNISSPETDALSGSSLRSAVREREEVLRDGDLRRLALAEEKRAVAAALSERAARGRAETGTVVLLGASLLAALFAATWLYQSIVTPLGRARKYAETVAAGDFAARLDHHERDEIGALTHAIESMKDSVVGKIDTMREVAGIVLVSAEELEGPVARVTAAMVSLADAPLARDAETLRDGTLRLARLAEQMVRD